MKIGFFALALAVIGIAGCCGVSVGKNREIRLASYNIYHCEDKGKSVDCARTAAVLRRARPDFIALQEVDSVTRRSKGIDQAAEIGKELGMHATYAKALQFQGGGYGVAVLSKEKPLSVARIPLPGREPRMLLLCEFEDIWFGSTHFSLQATNRLKSAEIVRKEVMARAASKPVFLAGDWNAKPRSGELCAMREFITVLSDENSRTYHGFKPFEPGSECCIDYIAVDSGHAGCYDVRASHVAPDYVTSDHCPVFVTVEAIK